MIKWAIKRLHLDDYWTGSKWIGDSDFAQLFDDAYSAVRECSVIEGKGQAFWSDITVVQFGLKYVPVEKKVP